MLFGNDYCVFRGNQPFTQDICWSKPENKSNRIINHIDDIMMRFFFTLERVNTFFSLRLYDDVITVSTRSTDYSILTSK